MSREYDIASAEDFPREPDFDHNSDSVEQDVRWEISELGGDEEEEELLEEFLQQELLENANNGSDGEFASENWFDNDNDDDVNVDEINSTLISVLRF